MVASKSDGVVTLTSRQGRDFTRRFPELVKALGGLRPKTFTLDGEVAVFDKGSSGTGRSWRCSIMASGSRRAAELRA
jgi:ATP-dependent DNA ligase